MRISDQVLAFALKNREHEQLVLLAVLSVLWLSPGQPEARRLLEAYREKNFDPAALYEAALQLFLLAGFQASLEAVTQIREVFGDSIPVPEPEALSAEEWLRRGYELQSQVYGSNVERLRDNLKELSPELAVWTVMIGYGLVLSRPGLPRYQRELLEVAVLAVQGFPRQLHSHLRGALNLGASAQEVEIVLEAIDGLLTEERRLSAWQVWREIRQ